MSRDLLVIAAAQATVCAAILLGAFISVNDRPVLALIAAVPS